MISISSEVRGKKEPLEFFGLSKDVKPTGEIEGVKITNGSVFIEMDTKKIYMYDEENRQWLEQ